MKSASVTDPRGRRWTVRRRWLPWNVRWRGGRRKKPASEGGSWFEWLEFTDPLVWFDDSLGGFAVILAAVIAMAVVVLFILPLFAFIVEVLLVLAVAAIAIALRIVFRRPWIIEAFCVEEGEAPMVWKVSGLRRSGAAVDEIASQLQAGVGVPSASDATQVRGRQGRS